MKKLLVILLSLAMTFTMFACGKEPDGQGDKDVENLTIVYEDEETTIYLTEDGQYIDQDGNPIVFEPEEGSDVLGDEYDFGFDMAKTYTFDKVMEKVDYNNLESLQEYFLTQTASLTKKAFGTDFSLDTGYSEADEDALVGAYGYENEDVDQKNIELGIYKSSEVPTPTHYITYSCECLYDVSDETLNKVITDLKNAFGITVSKDKLKASAEKLMNATEEELESIYDYQIIEKDYDLYTEMASLSTAGGAFENSHLWYVCVEIERQYD